MTPHPFLLTPIPRVMMWGGSELKDLIPGCEADGPVGEAWILSVRENADSVISSGEFRGITLREYLKRFPDALGKEGHGDGFPLLIKLINSRDKLSVQVHPDDEFARENEGEKGKCESWYIIDSEPGSYIISGLRDGVDPRSAAELKGSEYGDIFRICHPEPGDVFFIPPGQVHSIGPGILLAEIQQNSDLTYRIYDYGRIWNGKPRELHTEKAKKCVKNYTEDETESLRFSGGRSPDLTVNCEFFKIKKTVIAEGKPHKYLADADGFEALISVGKEDEIILTSGDASLPMTFGSCVFVPAGAGEITLRGHGTLLSAKL